MINELIFLTHTISICASVFVALLLGAPALTALISIQALLANLFVIKQTVLFGLTVTCTDAFAVGCGLALNTLQEYYGKKAAKQAIAISFFCLIFYLAMTLFQLWYLPAAHDATQHLWISLLSVTPRIVIASAVAYLCSQLTDYFLYKKLHTYNINFLLRNYGSLIISQLIDTVLFSILGLYGLVQSLGNIIFFSYLVKLFVILLATPLLSIARLYIKKPAQ